MSNVREDISPGILLNSEVVHCVLRFYRIVMLLSHCGEYPCECKNIYSRQIRQKVANIRRMGLRMQFATNRNDRQTFVGVRKHSRSFTANSSKIIRLSRRITEKRGLTNGYECLRISYESLRISYEAYDYLTISVANFLSKKS